MKKRQPLQFKASDVITTSKTGVLFVGGRRLENSEVINLQQEVNYFKSLRLYSIFMETVRDQARLTMFEKAMTFDDMRTGKAMLYALSVLENILNTVEKAPTKITPPVK